MTNDSLEVSVIGDDAFPTFFFLIWEFSICSDNDVGCIMEQWFKSTLIDNDCSDII